METNTQKKAAMEAFLGLYDFHTRLFHNVLEHISDDDAAKRLGTKANHMAWIAGSLVQQRFMFAKMLGITHFTQTSDALFSDNKGIQEDAVYPPLKEYTADWELISPLLRSAFAALSEEQLAGPDPFEMPGGDYTLSDTITFCTDRESYCIGQLGLWRRLLGYEAMRYD